MLRSRRSPLLAVLGLLAGLASASGASALTVGQVDDFEDGTTQGWTVGGGGTATPPESLADGGPGGAGDGFLLLQSTAESRLVGINRSQWAGDYTAAGITGISLQASNLGATDLLLRLYLADAPFAASNRVVSTEAVLLPSGSGWTQLFLPLSASHLTALSGDVASALSSAAELRILHGSTAAFPPEAVAGQLGLDDIQAIPEPASGALLALGLLGLAFTRRR